MYSINMKLHCLVLFVTFQTEAVNIGVEGEVSLNLKVKEDLQELSAKRSHVAENETTDAVEDRVVIKMGSNGNKITAGPIMECLYQYPEETQVQAILSNMMNQLTKVFVRATDMIKDVYERRTGTRFVVVLKKTTDFFEVLYTNMTTDYLSFYNDSKVQIYRTAQNKAPCKYQGEIKQMWKDLLDNSLATFRRTAFQCIEEQLKAQNRTNDVRIRAKLSKFLIKELGKIRTNQLVMLCDQFQLCYNELMVTDNTDSTTVLPTSMLEVLML